MFPSKSMVDYMSELNRLFPRSNENDLYASQYMSPLSGTNQSSSSAESTSPESFPGQPYTPERTRGPSGMELVDTPRSSAPDQLLMERRQRPIVGRKILPTPENSTPAYKPHIYRGTDSNSCWQTEEALTQSQHTPPNVNKFYIENKYTQNVFYELFPNENRGFEFPQFLTPVKQEPMARSPMSPSYFTPAMNVSPMSPSPMKVSPNFGHQTSPTRFPPSYGGLASQRPSYGGQSPMNYSQQAGSSGTRYPSPDLRQKMCTFCRKNGETPVVYMTHSVKERVGNKHVVSCPILRSHVCSTCGATGDDAHTITYCPVLRSSNNGLPLQSTTITLKNTRIKSNGRRRY